MAAMLETPSRVWRRIEAIEGQDMPSLPSLPAFEDSADHESETTDTSYDHPQDVLPIHSTPAAFSSHTMSTIRPPSSTASTARFAHSLASRSSKSVLSASRDNIVKQAKEESFDVSSIPSLPDMHQYNHDLDIRSSDQDTEHSSSPGAHSLRGFDGNVVEDVEGDLDLSDALQSVSRPHSPAMDDIATPSKKYDYSVSLRSEKKTGVAAIALRQNEARIIQTATIAHAYALFDSNNTLSVLFLFAFNSP
ncbi:uncharacterized protein FIBRA_04783 [Fibroporia radiculosa]|uniref:Uncharacterized protein n=1 Tax=Fibroporia radiculosa TaxID=599839 RepID=J4G7Y3_9APHY|nr:uncharacterized protein FIBRA_04783 [Fibroporia radiculosa]CCM02678.1 predicted protein [Fibroporia radiculosa]